MSKILLALKAIIVLITGYFLVGGVYAFFIADRTPRLGFRPITLDEFIIMYSSLIFLPVILHIFIKEYHKSVLENRKFFMKKGIYAGLCITGINATFLIYGAFNCSSEGCGFSIFFAPIVIVFGLIISLFFGFMFRSARNKVSQ